MTAPSYYDLLFEARNTLDRDYRDVEQYHLAKAYTPIQIEVPIEEALKLCEAIRSEFQSWVSYKKWRCLGCVLFGSDGIPVKLDTTTSPYCGCENVAKRYALAVQHVYVENTQRHEYEP